MTLRLLRGRVAVRPLDDVRSDIIVIPDTYDQAAHDHAKGVKAKSSHRGIVLGFGDLARVHEGCESNPLGVPVPRGFAVGDEVVFVYGAKGTEKSRRGQWTDGSACVWVAQEEVQAVIELEPAMGDAG